MRIKGEGMPKKNDPENNNKNDKKWLLRLYVAGQTPSSIKALNNLKKICEQHLTVDYEIEIIDLLKHPQLAKEHQILAIPTVIRRLPKPLRKAIGDLTNTESVLIGLDFKY